MFVFGFNFDFGGFDTFGYIAAPIPLVLGIIFLISYKIAAAAED